MKKYIYIVCVIIGLLSACTVNDAGFYDSEPVHIINYKPDTEFLVNESVVVYFRFSKKMNTKATQGAFKFEEDATVIDGVFKWSDNDRVMRYYPEKTCLFGKKYRVTLSTKAECFNGNDLKKAFEHNFQLGYDNVLPFVVSEDCSPDPNTRLGLEQMRAPFVITFSEPMDKRYPYNHMSIDPAIEGFYTWHDENDATVDQFSDTPCRKLVFTPYEDYVKQKYYTVTVNETFTDSAMNPLKEAYSLSFYTGDDDIIPEILSVTTDSSADNNLVGSDADFVINTGIEKDATITIEFSEDMDKDTVEKAIRFIPSVSYDVDWTDAGHLTLTLKKDEYFGWNTNYRLEILDSAQDLQENSLAKTYQYVFLIDGADSRPPVVASIDILYDNTSDGVGAGNDIFYNDILDNLVHETYTINCYAWGNNFTKKFIFTVFFDAVTDIDIGTLIDSMSFKSIADPETKLEIMSFRDAGIQGGYYAYEFDVYATGSAQGSITPDAIISLSILGDKSNVKDINNNFMQDNVEFYLIFNYE